MKPIGRTDSPSPLYCATCPPTTTTGQLRFKSIQLFELEMSKKNWWKRSGSGKDPDVKAPDFSTLKVKDSGGDCPGPGVQSAQRYQMEHTLKDYFK